MNVSATGVTKGINVVNESSTNSLGSRRAGLAVALLASGVLLVLWAASGVSAAGARPDGPEKVFALTIKDKLLRFDGDTPQQIQSKQITGLVRGESLVGIDFRPATGRLIGIGDRGYVYKINPATADATRGPRINADGEPVALRGNSSGIDFNPTVDRLRIVSNANQNLRVDVRNGALADFDENPNNGTQPDLNLKYAANDPNAGQNPDVTGVAYRNSKPAAFGGMNTELYDIDARTDDLSEQDPPNNGVLNTEGPLGVNTNLLVGFDIVTRGPSPSGDRGFAALNQVTKPGAKFYKINLNTGDANPIGWIGGGRANVEGLAIPIGQQ